MRIGYSWRTGPGTRTWVSMGFWGWLLMWLLALPVIAVWLVIWLVIKLCVGLVRLVVWAAGEIHRAPAIPPKLRKPPPRP